MTQALLVKQGFALQTFKNFEEAIIVAVNEKIRIKIKGYEHAVVDAAAAKIVEAVKRSGAQVSGPIPLPTDKEIITILRAVHKYKYSREQFEMRTHKRLIVVIRPTKETLLWRPSSFQRRSQVISKHNGTQVMLGNQPITKGGKNHGKRNHR